MNANERRRVVDVKNRADNKTYYCVWCEKSYSVPEITDEDEPKVVHEKRWVAIKKHVETCPMHPTHLLAEERDQRETNSTILFGVSKLVAGKLGEIVKFARANRGAVDSLAFTRLIVEAGREMERFDKTLDFLEDMEYIAYQAGKGTHKCG